MKGAIRANIGARLGTIDRRIYGVMFENCGRCLHDGLWVGENSPVANWRGVRKDVLGLLQSLRVPIIRWPGGTPSETYHWYEGVGPRAERPKSLLAGRVMTSPSNHSFGTDEYMMLRDEVGFDPYICVNVGTGTAEEAANWVEYCNCDGDTTFAALKVANGHPEPFGVTWWGIGNESYFWHDARSYAQLIRQYARVMKLVDPTIRLVAAGLQDDDEWNGTILQEAGEAIDYISLHFFYGTMPIPLFIGGDYDSLQASPLHAERCIRRLQQQIREITGSERIRVVVDEYAVWNAEATEELGGQQNLALQDGLWVAGMIHMFHRVRDCVDMGIMANLVNSTNAVTTCGDRIICSPAYHALHLYANHAGSVLLDADVDSDAYTSAVVDRDVPYFDGSVTWEDAESYISTAADRPVPYLDCSPTLDDDGKTLSLAVINRSREEDIDCAITLEGGRPVGSARVYEINGPNETKANDLGAPDRVVTIDRPLDGLGQRFTYCFPAHSITLLKIPVDP